MSKRTCISIYNVSNRKLLPYTYVILCFIVLLFLSIDSFAQKEGQALVDSLEHTLISSADDTNRVKVLNTISYNFFFINPDSGAIYGEQARSLANKLGWRKGIATAHKNIGNAYLNKSVYDTALDQYSKAQQIFEELHDLDGIARVLGNMGSIYDDLGDYPKALEYELKALDIYEQMGDNNGKARIYGTIGNLYETPKKYNEALRYYTLALDIHLAAKDKRSIAIDMGNVGNIYSNLKEYKKAMDFDLRSLAIYGELGDSSSIANKLQNIADLYANMNDLDNALVYSFRSLKIYERVNDKDGIGRVLANIGGKLRDLAKNIIAKNKAGGIPTIARVNLQNSIVYTLKAIDIFKEIGEVNALAYTFSELASEYELLGNYKDALTAHKEYLTLKDSALNNAKNIRFANLEKEHAIDRMKSAEKEKMVQIQLNEVMKVKKRNETILFSIGIVILLTGILLVLRQRKKTEELLLNILPEKIAERLKMKEHPIADHFGDASIIFIDIAGFTKLSAINDPKTLVNMLNDIFTKFDAIAGKHGLEKIKTIGDCYMAVAGIPEKDPNHPLQAAAMALEVRDTMKGYVDKNGTDIHFRIGIDCGMVVAGVIGKKKFIYDIWGDAVNTASRMESSGIPGEIHCTDNFKKRLPANYVFTSRGEISIKGKGMMHTWILASNH